MGTKINTMDNNESENEMNNDPANWTWNIIYFNPKDKRLFVPKRIPIMGMTLNFANPNSFLIATILIILIAIATKFST